MQNLLLNISLLLEQTPQEKNLTLLYVSIFAFFCLLLFIDTRDGKKLVDGNKLLKKIIIVMLILSVAAMVVLHFVL